LAASAVIPGKPINGAPSYQRRVTLDKLFQRAAVGQRASRLPPACR
jgi:hypothetical protein